MPYSYKKDADSVVDKKYISYVCGRNMTSGYPPVLALKVKKDWQIVLHPLKVLECAQDYAI